MLTFSGSIAAHRPVRNPTASRSVFPPQVSRRNVPGAALIQLEPDEAHARAAVRRSVPLGARAVRLLPVSAASADRTRARAGGGAR